MQKPSSKWSRSWQPGRGIHRDFHDRLVPHYCSDWRQGFGSFRSLLAPSTYIFFASVLPALAFGQQLAMDTEGVLTVVHVLAATALAGLAQAVVGGQPLLILGVAEPIVIIYGFLFSFAKTAPGLGVQRFLPWVAWVCIWTSLLCCLLALLGAAGGITLFTRFSGELFGALITILFLQVGIKGIVREFYPPADSPSEPWQLTLINGLWSLLLALGLLLSCLGVLRARQWRLGTSALRGLLADYGVPAMVLLWSGVSFAVTPAPGVPRRVATPNTWEVVDTWSVAARLGEVPHSYIAAALLPAAIITLLFYFDHNVSSQLAQQPEFNLVKGPAYHWDFLLLALLTLVCGLLGLPPVNGVLPQAPMHTRSLAHIRTRPRPAPGPDPTSHHQPAATEDNSAAGGHPDTGSDTNTGLSCSSEAGWAPQQHHSYGSTRAAAPQGSYPAVAAVAQALSQLHLSSGPSGSHLRQQPEDHTAPLPGLQQQQQQQQQQQHISALTTALSHMHLDGPYQSDLSPSPFGTPTASASAAAAAGALQPDHCPHSASTSGHGPSSCWEQSVLRHRQTCLSPTHTVASTAAGNCAQAQAQHYQQQGRLQAAQQVSRERLQHPCSPEAVVINTLPDSGAALHDDGCKRHPHICDSTFLQLEVREQRVSNLLQSLLVAVCLGATPAIQAIPTGVLWGYFILLAVQSTDGSQLCERLLLLATDSKKRLAVMQQEHATYLQLVPFKVVVRFTLLQLVYLLAVWALTTWAGVGGVAFPLPIMALVPLRRWLLPHLFDPQHLALLDAAEYDEAPAVDDKLQAAQELCRLGAVGGGPSGHLLPGSNIIDAAVELCEEDEADVVSREFKGLHIRHHLTRTSVEQQQQQQQRTSFASSQ